MYRLAFLAYINSLSFQISTNVQLELMDVIPMPPAQILSDLIIVPVTMVTRGMGPIAQVSFIVLINNRDTLRGCNSIVGGRGSND